MKLGLKNTLKILKMVVPFSKQTSFGSWLTGNLQSLPTPSYCPIVYADISIRS